MENITLGQVASFLAFVVALTGGVTGLIAIIKKPLKKRDEELRKYIALVIKTEVEPLNETLIRVENEQKKTDMESTKNFLVQFMANVERGLPIDEIETQRFWEQFEHYEKCGGNGYIHQKLEKLKAKELL